MPSRIRSSLAFIGALTFIAGAFFLLTYRVPATVAPNEMTGPSAGTDAQTALVQTGLEALSPTPRPATSNDMRSIPSPHEATGAPPESDKEQTVNEATRIKSPYPLPPKPIETLNSEARSALVNILCETASGSFRSISGSGVIIDPRGVILTNAHIAQHVLLSESPEMGLTCTIRSGAPAAGRWVARVLYIPPVWVESHAHEIRTSRPTGTGEHDYALLLVAGSLDGVPLSAFPYLPIDTREAIGFQDDRVLVASYPAEFLGDIAAKFNLYPVTSVATIGRLFTFVEKTVDLISLGGIVGAQSGSSGGAIVNMWGRLIGLIATTSEGDTTATRDLRALTLSYIDRDLTAQTQVDLRVILGGDVLAQTLDFNARLAPRLVGIYAQIGR